MLKRLKSSLGLGAWLWVLTGLLVGCNRAAPPTATPSPVPSQASPSPVAETPTLTQTEITATLTAIPLAAIVNGLGITLAEYQTWLALYQGAQAERGTGQAAEETG